MRTGLGYDLHRLKRGRKLLLGGVEIPFKKGENAHSDGDVLLHAITDSLLGACGMGDIGDVNTRYDRLEKKGAVLDQTMNEIDSAFENLKTLETGIKSVQDSLNELPSEIEQIKLTVDTLLSNRERAEHVCEKMESVDFIVGELNAKIDNLKNAREWVAATETRLLEISKDSQAQLKLMSDLFKAEPAERSDSGAPTLSVQENVLRLSRQGWTAGQIANALKLSIGEVELILEYADKI